MARMCGWDRESGVCCRDVVSALICAPRALAGLEPRDADESCAGRRVSAGGSGGAACHERVAVHLERAGLVLAFGAAEGVDRLAGCHVGEANARSFEVYGYAFLARRA